MKLPPGKKLQNPVCACSLAWVASQEQNDDHMLAVSYEAIVEVGLNEHEALIVLHLDQEHSHVHVITNRVQPQTGKTFSLCNSKKRISEPALADEQHHGLACQ